MSILQPRGDRFYRLLEDASANVCRGAQMLLEMLVNYSDLSAKAKAIKDVEHTGDELTHKLYELLNRIFVTPLDREDIAGLASSLDDILDLVEASADDFVVCGIETPTGPSIEMAQLIVHCAAKVQEAIGLLRDRKNHPEIRQLLTDINSLENEGDRVYRSAMQELFRQTDAVYVIKWKQVYDHLERAIDSCEDVADELYGVILKYA
jgi:uncharacterized protein Yka (UPF0111/DUF47 family)